jgi:hypothetical protein
METISDLTIPWRTIEHEAKDRGCYILLLEVPKPVEINIGSLGQKQVKAGYHFPFPILGRLTVCAPPVFYMKHHPLQDRSYLDLLAYFRLDRLVERPR